MSDETPEVVQHADDAYEAIRAINHLTINARSLPAPLVYRVLGNLKALGLSQTLGQLASGLGRSLDTHDVHEDDGRDPVQSIATAIDHLTRAAELAAQLSDELAKAQNAISRQGYNDRSPDRSE